MSALRAQAVSGLASITAAPMSDSWREFYGHENAHKPQADQM